MVFERCFHEIAGCVEVRPYPSSKSTELTYLLDSRVWEQGRSIVSGSSLAGPTISTVLVHRIELNFSLDASLENRDDERNSVCRSDTHSNALGREISTLLNSKIEDEPWTCA